MPTRTHPVQVRDVTAESTALARSVDGFAVIGHGRDVLLAIEGKTGINSVELLDTVANQLLVQKGADWTSVIASEYLRLYEDSVGTFALVWDHRASMLVAHGSVFQSMKNPSSALVAHIRTADEYKGLGLGTLVTEEVTAAAFRQGAEYVMLATDDKIHRVQLGERASHAMYARLGFSVLAEKRLADTVDWLMVVDRPIFQECQAAKAKNSGKFSPIMSKHAGVTDAQLVDRVRSEYGIAPRMHKIEPVSAGDLAHLFALLNLCPATDYRLKLTAWNIHHGPEIERSFITSVRQAIVDKDRLQDASFVLRNERGAILAMCGAQQLLPFTRQTFAIDFYCLPMFFDANSRLVTDLVQETISKIEKSFLAPRPARLSFWGIDAAKVALFQSLGFSATGNTAHYCGSIAETNFSAAEYVRTLN